MSRLARRMDSETGGFVESGKGRHAVMENPQETPQWLAELRDTALQQCRTAALPDRVAHLWRYSDPNWFVPETAPDKPINRGKKQGALPDWLKPRIGELERSQAPHLALCNGQIVSTYQPPGLLTSGVTLSTLAAGIVTDEALVRAHLGRYVGPSFGKFEALNLATWDTGVLVAVPKNFVSVQPLQLIIATDASRAFSSIRLLIVLAQQSAATVAIELLGDPKASTAQQLNIVLEVAVGAGAALKQIMVQNLSNRTHALLTNRGSVDRDGHLTAILTSFGGEKVKADLGTVLTGKGAETKFVGVAFAQDRQHLDHHTVHQHLAGNTTSDLDFKVVLKGKARSAYTGLIRIEKDAPFCEAYQENRNLLLSKNARADSIPELEIMTDEVRCTHGATVGSIDLNQVFYLMSRGIPNDEAIRLIVAGFLEHTIQIVPDELREQIRELAAQRISDF